MADKRLGKGLGALIPTYSTDDGDRYIDGAAPIDQIIANRNQPRQDFNPKDMEELTTSIKAIGILQPLTVRDMGDGKLELIAGERRLRAAREAGLETVPVYILSIDADVEMMEYALVENVQRVDLNPIEEAEGYAILSGKYGLSQEEIAGRVAKSRSAVANSLRLLKLPPRIKVGLKQGEISSGHARAMLGLRKSLQMMILFERVKRDGLNVRQTEEWIQKLSDKPESGERIKKRSSKNLHLVEFENGLISHLGTKVSIQRNLKGKGKIQIEFYSDEDLERLLDLITEN